MSLPRSPIGSLDRRRVAGPLRLAGRVLARLGPDRVLLADASGQVELEGVEGPRPGDTVEVTVRPEGERFRVEELRVLTPYRREVPFPSPGGEFYRLRRPVTPGAGVSRVELLAQRAACLRALRAFFDERGYVEVQTPLCVRAPGLEPHLVARPAADGFLITSPEYQMKRLLAAGLERIYFLGPCWRGDEIGEHHLGEFTMLEWYCAYSGIEELMTVTEELLAEAARSVRGATRITYQGKALELRGPYVRLSVAEACRRHAGVELDGAEDTATLRARAEAAGLGPFSEEDGYDAVFSRILVERVEPALAREGPLFLWGYPPPLAALARIEEGIAQRFELYAGGLELANAFGELTDPDEQLARLQGDQRARRARGAPEHSIDERFIEALREGIPPAAGIALGVDRLVMLLLDQRRIQDVVAFAPDEI